MNEKKETIITVTIQGGVIQFIEIPKGSSIVVKVKDYDTEELTVEDFNELPVDENGDKYHLDEWRE